MKKLIFSVIILSLIFTGCSTNISKTNLPKEPTRIGAILPLTGDLATYGQGIKNAIEMALSEQDNSKNIELIIEDDLGCDLDATTTAAQKLINIDKIHLIIGSVCSGATLTFAPLTEEAEIVAISPSSSSKSITTAGKYIYRVIDSDANKSVAIANYAYKKGYRKAAMLYNVAQDAFVQQKIDSMETFEKLGGKTVSEEAFTDNTSDFRSLLTKIKSTDAQVIFLGATPAKGALILKQIQELNLNLQVIGTETALGTDDLIKAAGSAANGLIFPFATTPDNKEHQEYKNKYEQNYGSEAPAYSAEGYDAAMLAVQALVASDLTAKSIAKNLQKIGNEYYGASGIITFDENGDVQKPMAINTIIDGKIVRVE